MRKSIQKLSTLLLALFLVIGMIPASVMASADPTVSYCTHVQNEGWQDYKSNGVMSGTEGKSYRLEGIKVKLDTQGYDLGISYQTHIQNIGWEADTSRGWKSNDDMSGTEGLSYRLEAIQIKLTGSDADKFDIYYQVHAQNIGWMGWAKNGESAGTAGFGYRLEGIKIVIVPTGSGAPGSIDKPFIRKLTNSEFESRLYGYWYNEDINQGYLRFSNAGFWFGKWGSTTFGGACNIVETTENGGTIYVANVMGEGYHGPAYFYITFDSQGANKVSVTSEKWNSYKYIAAENLGNGQYRMPIAFDTYTNGNILTLNN